MHDAVHGLGEPFRAHGLEQVVESLELERLHRGLLVRRHEHHGRRLREPREHAGEVETVQARHADVQEHRVERLPGVHRAVQHPKRLRGVGDRFDVGDARIGAQQVHEVFQRGCLVVDGEHPQGALEAATSIRPLADGAGQT